MPPCEACMGGRGGYYTVRWCAAVGLVPWSLVGFGGLGLAVYSVKRYPNERPPADIRSDLRYLHRLCPTSLASASQSAIGEGSGRYIGGLISPIHTGLECRCDAPDRPGVTRFEGGL